MTQYILYKKDSCPFCQKVMSFIKNNDIQDIEYRDIIEEPKFKEELVENGGQNQVPCLFIDGKPLYESDDIIDYLEKNLVEGEPKDPYESQGPHMCPID